jgi:hypothetical protein
MPKTAIRLLIPIMVLVAVCMIATPFQATAFASSGTPYDNSYTTGVGGSWMTVALQRSGSVGVALNRNVNIIMVPSILDNYTRVDVRMLNANGQIVWEEHGAIAVRGGRTFWVSHNVYSIQIRVFNGVNIPTYAKVLMRKL